MGAIFLDIHVDQLASVLALFDKIQVWRSPTELGTYSEVTGEVATAARLVGSVVGPWTLAGETLTLVLNNTSPIDIIFTGTDPLNLSAVLQQINTAVPGLSSESAVGVGKLALTSTLLGTQSSLQVSGSAAIALGLSTTKVNGQSERIGLTSPTTEYRFTDFDGDSSFFYKTRYFSSITTRVSDFSESRQGNPSTVVPAEALTLASISLADGAGRPIVGRRIILVPQSTAQAIGYSPYGLLSGFDKVIVLTDSKGYAQTNLIRGVTYRLLIEGAQFERTFVAPDFPTFDLLQVATTAPDPFSIVQAPPRPIRVS